MSDAHNRLLALDPSQSFIVQAPAGSGKTELLTQRFLKLLSLVEKPEEILAVTFTRKAASEMRHRIISALKFAATNPQVNTEHGKRTYDLAQAVLQQDKKHKWDLTLYPNRLRIQTIDAVCAYIANRMPVLSNMGASPEIIDYPNEYYQQAVERLLKETVQDEVWSKALSQLFLHLDNRISFIHDLLENMLAKRDQWLPYLVHLSQDNVSLQMFINEGISRLISLHLARLTEAFSENIKQDIILLLKYASCECKAQNEQNFLAQLKEDIRFPNTHQDDLLVWLGVTELLLTKDNNWRKSFTVKNGFPSPSETKDKALKELRKARKDEMSALIEQLKENQVLLQLLTDLRSLPIKNMSDEQSTILNAMGTLLPVLVAHLQVVFQEKGKIDFIEVNLRALQAMGDELTPSDISLSLDYQIKHILIDEYQDTSSIQFRLFEKLIMGWQQGDGRTLFVVGDPMQSIYKFRGAEVTLFLKTQENGIGGINLKPLTLSANFRSSSKIVNWINDSFVSIFPPVDEKSLGGVKYEQALAQRPIFDENAVTFHALFDESTQSDLVVSLISKQISQHPDESIAVLVRAKSHLVALIEKLKQLRISFVAVEIEHLATRSHVMDLLSLLQAVIDWNDKIAWFSILRAPWLGLSLADLLVIANATQNGVVWETLCQFESISELSSDAKVRLKKFVCVMDYWLSQRQRNKLGAFIRGLWVSLGGPYCYRESYLLNDIDKIISLIGRYFDQNASIQIDELKKRISLLYADVSVKDQTDDKALSGKIELMTIHKAKGLEFDTVILPHLHAKTKNHGQALMLWFEHAHHHGIDLILAPKRAYKEDNDPLYSFVDSQIRKKSEYEDARLLYVGATRAKKRLHFVGLLEKSDEDTDYKLPPKGSFLRLLWPHLKIAESEQLAAKPLNQEALEPVGINRLKQTIELPSALQNELYKNELIASVDSNRPEPSDIIARAAGTVFHKLMNRINPSSMIYHDAIVLALKRHGLHQDMLSKAYDLVSQGFDNMLNCEIGKWILSSNHLDRKSEWQLSVKKGDKTENIIIDCAFVDADNIRWIVDYKLTHQTMFSEADLKSEIEKYRTQLQKYQRALMLLENRVVRCGLYFPMAKQWYEYA
ncbi:MAG: UvrD-helicase domain-containing protein [Candidatus Berkiella sp.]